MLTMFIGVAIAQADEPDEMKTRLEPAETRKDGCFRRPLFPIGVVAELLRVTPATLRLWEKKRLVRPRRLGKNRFYSYADYDRLREIAYLLRKQGMNIAGVRGWLKSRCWEVKRCGPERYRCPVFETRAPKLPEGFAALPGKGLP